MPIRNYNYKLQQVAPRKIQDPKTLLSFFPPLPLKLQFQTFLIDTATGLGQACKDAACFKCVSTLH